MPRAKIDWREVAYVTIRTSSQFRTVPEPKRKILAAEAGEFASRWRNRDDALSAMCDFLDGALAQMHGQVH